jgi:hypothetical protein
LGQPNPFSFRFHCEVKAISRYHLFTLMGIRASAMDYFGAPVMILFLLVHLTLIMANLEVFDSCREKMPLD